MCVDNSDWSVHWPLRGDISEGTVCCIDVLKTSYT